MKECIKSSNIGGQAVMEGVMMRNRDKYAVSVRKQDGEIVTEVFPCKDPKAFKSIWKLPIFRGMAAFADSLKVGTAALNWSSEFYVEEDSQPTKFDKWIDKVSKGHGEKIISGLIYFFAILLAVGIFVVFPLWVAGLLETVIGPYWIRALIEGVLRVLLFIGYVFAISQINDIKRVFMYHGAEHKCINCIEHGQELTVENAMKASKQHRRCGTSFLLIVVIISVLFFMVINVDSRLLKLALRIVLIPVIAGVSYEFLKFSGKSNNKFVIALSKPGLWLQGLTTREPDEQMIEVAIRSVEAVFDWKDFQKKHDS